MDRYARWASECCWGGNCSVPATELLVIVRPCGHHITLAPSCPSCAFKHLRQRTADAVTFCEKPECGQPSRLMAHAFLGWRPHAIETYLET